MNALGRGEVKWGTVAGFIRRNGTAIVTAKAVKLLAARHTTNPMKFRY